MNITENIDYITKHLSEGDILCQIAEEASELAKAALKLKRAIEGTNPTPVTKKEAWENLMEEHSDIELCYWITEMMFKDMPKEDLSGEILINKADRWCQRLKNAKGGANHDS